MSNIIFLGLLNVFWIAVGAFILFGTFKQQDLEKKNRSISLATALSMICGGSFSLSGMLLGHPQLGASSLLSVTGALMIIMFANSIVLIRTCNLQIDAKFVNFETHVDNKAQRYYTGIFEYSYGGTLYQRPLPVTYTKKKLLKKYTLGSYYPIWICEETPSICTDKKHLSSLDFCLLIGGCMMLCIFVLFMTQS